MRNKISTFMMVVVSLTLVQACDSGRDQVDALKQQAGKKADQILKSTEKQADALKDEASRIVERGEKKVERAKNGNDVQARDIEAQNHQRSLHVDLQSEFSKDSAEADLRSEQIAQYQQQLRIMGHFKGNVDGKLGPQTRAALRDFQSSENLQATGQLDSKTQNKLLEQAGPEEGQS